MHISAHWLILWVWIPNINNGAYFSICEKQMQDKISYLRTVCGSISVWFIIYHRVICQSLVFWFRDWNVGYALLKRRLKLHHKAHTASCTHEFRPIGQLTPAVGADYTAVWQSATREVSLTKSRPFDYSGAQGNCQNHQHVDYWRIPWALIHPVEYVWNLFFTFSSTGDHINSVCAFRINNPCVGRCCRTPLLRKLCD